LSQAKPSRPVWDDLGFEVIGGPQHNWRTFNTRLPSGTSAGSFAFSSSQALTAIAEPKHETGAKNELYTYSEVPRGCQFELAVTPTSFGYPLSTTIVCLNTR